MHNSNLCRFEKAVKEGKENHTDFFLKFITEYFRQYLDLWLAKKFGQNNYNL